MLKILYCTLPKLKNHQDVLIQSLKLNSVSYSSNESQNFLTYSADNADKILKVVNNNDTSEFHKYIITKHCKEKLISHRQINGPFVLLDDLLTIKGIRRNTLEKFCESVVNGGKLATKCRIRRITTSPVPTNIADDANTYTGIYIGNGTLSWAKLNLSYTVSNWDCINFSEEIATGTSIFNSVEVALKMIKEIPESDVYVIEERTIPRSPYIPYRQKIAYVYEQQLATAIFSCFATRTSKRNIFTLKPQASARFFKLIIGKETISTHYFVNKLFSTNDNNQKSDSNVIPLCIHDEVKGMYEKMGTEKQQQMNLSLITIMAFLSSNKIDGKGKMTMLE